MCVVGVDAAGGVVVVCGDAIYDVGGVMLLMLVLLLWLVLMLRM